MTTAATQTAVSTAKIMQALITMNDYNNSNEDIDDNHECEDEDNDSYDDDDNNDDYKD